MRVRTINISARADNVVNAFVPVEEQPDQVMLRINCTLASDLTGLHALADWKITIINVGSGVLTLKHASASSRSPNRFLLRGSVDRVLLPFDSCVAFYDSGLGAWLVR